MRNELGLLRGTCESLSTALEAERSHSRPPSLPKEEMLSAEPQTVFNKHVSMTKRLQVNTETTDISCGVWELEVWVSSHKQQYLNTANATGLMQGLRDAGLTCTFHINAAANTHTDKTHLETFKLTSCRLSNENTGKSNVVGSVATWQLHSHQFSHTVLLLLSVWRLAR